MAIVKKPQDVVVVNCQEIPEAICVETLFITHASAKQKKNGQVYYVSTKNGYFDLTRQDQSISTKNFRPVTKPTTATVSLQAKRNTTPVDNVQQRQPIQQAQTACTTIAPLVTALTNLNSSNSCNVFNNLSACSSLESAVIPLSNTAQKFNLNNSIMPGTLLGTTNTLSIANIRRTFSDQLQQTDVSSLNMRTIAIQCKLDDELGDMDVEWPSTTEDNSKNPKKTESEKENFLKFIKVNSTQHKNYKECLICGEVCKSNQYFYGHMAIHQGPNVLCCKCGQTLDHKNLLLQHKCRNANLLEKAVLQCPHYTCSVKAISLLELYDHINEHVNNRMYKCSACRKDFCTRQEFLRHLLIRAKCYTSAKRKRLRIFGLESQKDRLCRVRVFTLHTFKKCTTLVKTFLTQREAKQRVCKICLRYFTNSRHRITCITKFRRRIIRKRHK